MDGSKSTPALPPPQYSSPPAAQQGGSNKGLIWAIVIAVLVLGLLVAGIIYLVQPGTPVAQIRDIFIIFMALVFLLVAVALIILSVQIAYLIILLRTEIKPILRSANETVSTLRGTSSFLSDNMVEPVIKLNEYVAALRAFFTFPKIFRRK